MSGYDLSRPISERGEILRQSLNRALARITKLEERVAALESRASTPEQQAVHSQEEAE